jgi:hypothetical protein
VGRALMQKMPRNLLEDSFKDETTLWVNSDVLHFLCMKIFIIQAYITQFYSLITPTSQQSTLPAVPGFIFREKIKIVCGREHLIHLLSVLLFAV